MREISASIIVLAATVLLAAAAQTRDGIIQIALLIIGCALGLFGLARWLISFNERQ